MLQVAGSKPHDCSRRRIETSGRALGRRSARQPARDVIDRRQGRDSSVRQSWLVRTVYLNTLPVLAIREQREQKKKCLARLYFGAHDRHT